MANRKVKVFTSIPFLKMSEEGLVLTVEKLFISHFCEVFWTYVQDVNSHFQLLNPHLFSSISYLGRLHYPYFFFYSIKKNNGKITHVFFGGEWGGCKLHWCQNACEKSRRKEKKIKIFARRWALWKELLPLSQAGLLWLASPRKVPGLGP